MTDQYPVGSKGQTTRNRRPVVRFYDYNDPNIIALQGICFNCPHGWERIATEAEYKKHQYTAAIYCSYYNRDLRGNYIHEALGVNKYRITPWRACNYHDLYIHAQGSSNILYG